MLRLSLALLMALPAFGALTPAQRQANIDSFEYVWKTVRDKHFDPKLNGVDWQAAHAELLPRVEKAESMAEARAAMQDLLGRLKQTHFGIIPNDTYEQMKPGAGSREGDAGIDARFVEGAMLVSSVRAGSPAAVAGVHPGWEIVAVDGAGLAPAVARVEKTFAKSLFLPIALRSLALSRLAGAPGSTVKVRFRDGAGELRDVAIERVEQRGQKVEFGLLPPMYVWSDWRKIEGNVGYLAFNMFMDPEALIAKTAEAVKACKDCAGFIIDVRGNPGGIGGLAMGLGGWFVDKPGLRLGTLSTRDTKLRFVLYPRPEAYSGPLAILVDGCSGSTAEIFAGGMKDIKRARIFGSRTAGAALPSIVEKLPNGDGFQYAFANYVSEGGQPLEGNGVAPDVEAPLTRKALLAGRDDALEAALGWIRQQKNGEEQ
jgi:carboxyl-terminal processing protease